MPSENVQDGLPSYQRVYSLRRLAAAVIRGMPRATRQVEARTARRAEAGRERRTAPAEPRDARRGTASGPARSTTEAPRDRPALPPSPHRTYDDTAVAVERLREHLRRERRPEAGDSRR